MMTRSFPQNPSTEKMLLASDDSFRPEDSNMSSLEDTSYIDLQEEPKYIVFESCLEELFTLCKFCRSPVAEIKKMKEGSLLKISVICVNHCQYMWSSHPSVSGIAAGNLLIAAAILFSGLTFNQFRQWAALLRLASISETTFYTLQRENLWPVVNEAWTIHQSQLFDELQNKPLKLAGDGRCDSPGHTAKYGTYTMIETETNKVVDFQLVQKSEVDNSACMEKEGLMRCLQKLEENNLHVQRLTTDRHPQIQCYMKQTKIQHQFDLWHVSKSVIKKLSQKANGKKCEDLRVWIRSVSNHLWWCSATCNGDYDLLRAKWTSVIHHVANRHRWGYSTLFPHCEHEKPAPQYVDSTAWLKPGSPSHDALKEVVLEKKLLKDLEKLTEFSHTGCLEVYHSMLTKYCPKRQHFHYEGMVARTMLAVLDHNHNTGRGQATTTEGEERYRYEWSKI